MSEAGLAGCMKGTLESTGLGGREWINKGSGLLACEWQGGERWAEQCPFLPPELGGSRSFSRSFTSEGGGCGDIADTLAVSPPAFCTCT